MIFPAGLWAQQTQTADLESIQTSKLNTALSNFSVTATLGTPAFGTNEINNLTFRQVRQLSLADLNIAYKMNSRVSIGLSAMSNLSSGNSRVLQSRKSVLFFLR